VNGFFFDGRWLVFALGVLVYYWVNYSRRFDRRVIAVMAASVVLSAALRQWVKNDLVGSHLDDHHKMITTELLVGSAFALALGLLHAQDKALARSAALRPLMVCGQMCYSLYLVHWPVTKPVVTALYLL